MTWFFVAVDLGKRWDPTAIAVVERAELAGKWDAFQAAYRQRVEYRVRHLERIRLLVPARNGAISAGFGRRQWRHVGCENPIGEDAVGTLHQILHHPHSDDRSVFLKVGTQTNLGGNDLPAALLPVLPASLPTFQTSSRPGRLQPSGVSGQTA